VSRPLLRAGFVVLVGLALIGGLVRVLSSDDGVTGYPRDVDVYRGLGAWVDVFDFAPAYQGTGGTPVVTPASVEALALRGVRTLFLQASRLDDRSPEMIVDEELVGRFLEEAHRHEIRVVGWYLPKFGDVDVDLRHTLAMADFEHDGHRFDGLALDIEWTEDVPDHAQRNSRLVELSERLRAEVGDDALGAIVLPPVQLEVVNEQLWPEFPWRRLHDLYDVWMPMDYWTFRTEASGYRDAFRYTEENLRRLAGNVEDPDPVVHPIGGIGDAATEDDYAGFVRALDQGGAVGGSVYDFRTTSEGGWVVLQRGIPNPAD
jgi:hypothetical protein